MKDIIAYKDFIATVHFNADDEVFFGKIEGINDLITFEGKSVIELKKAFHESVDEYILLCKKAGKEIYKSYKGSFNIRISPSLHKKAVQKATIMGIPLNQLVQNVLEKELLHTK
jgi:predicted HicB family RNase H-like nuclease